MKEVEITAKVNDTLEECAKKLEKLNYKIIRKSFIDDIYMTQKLGALNENNIDDILKSCVLIRYLNANGEEFKKITYKKKIYKDSTIISEQKINVDCSDLKKAVELFEALEFDKLVRVKYEVVVFSDGIKEFAFQNVENLGLLLEYESIKDMDNCTDEQIIIEKKNMLREVMETGINIDENIMDVKKAYELIKKNMLEK